MPNAIRHYSTDAIQKLHDFVLGIADIAAIAPALTLTDTTASAKSLKIDVDANIAQIKEKAGASGSLLSLDLVNNFVGIGTAVPTAKLHIVHNVVALRVTNLTGGGQVEFNPQAAAYAIGTNASGANNLKINIPTAVGDISPTALLHIKAGTAAANTAPLKLTSGTSLTTPEAGAVEFNGTDLFITDSTPTRRAVLLATGWTAYTPVVTSETGGWTNYTATGFYRVVDKMLKVSFRVVFSAASGVVDGMLISLPTGLTMNASVMAGGAGWDTTHIGRAVLGDNGTISGVPAMITTRTSTTVLVKYYNAAAASYLTGVGLTNTAPWTWAVSDEVVGEFTVPIT